MSAALANQVGPRVLAALGLPVERCMGFSMTFEAGDVVTVEARYYPNGAAIDEVVQIIKTLRAAE